jgi:hypothetical protein
VRGKELENKVKMLSEQLQEKVLNYIDNLLAEQDKKLSKAQPFNYEWEGALKDISDNTDSVELQHKSLRWR